MEPWQAWIGDINAVVGREIAGLICVAAASVCGAVIGLERESRDKPAGLRTLMLICLGSTIFTLVSLLLASQREIADPARLAAQIIPGVGFLGAGAIIRSRGTVVGLTTGATIWAVAAVGVTVGAGYVVAGAVFTLLILFVLTMAKRMEWLITGRCVHRETVVSYRNERGKTWPRLQAVLDNSRIRIRDVVHERQEEGESAFRVRFCTFHREHRSVIQDLAEIPEVLAIDIEAADR